MAKNKNRNNKNNIEYQFKKIRIDDLPVLDALTNNQRKAFDSFRENKNMVLHGLAGTGKSFISIYLALEQVLDPSNKYKKLIVIRSTVPTRDMGFMPGTEQEKIAMFEAPYHAICEELFSYKDAYKALKQQNNIEFISTSYIRGVTWNNSIIIVDELQNMTFHELDSIVTRLGDNSKIVLCGDYTQTDLCKHSDKQGLHKFLTIVRSMNLFTYIDFKVKDIVRSAFVKAYIIAKHETESNGL